MVINIITDEKSQENCMLWIPAITEYRFSQPVANTSALSVAREREKESLWIQGRSASRKTTTWSCRTLITTESRSSTHRWDGKIGSGLHHYTKYHESSIFVRWHRENIYTNYWDSVPRHETLSHSIHLCLAYQHFPISVSRPAFEKYSLIICKIWPSMAP